MHWGEEDTILLIVKDVTELNHISKIKLQNKYKSMALCTLSHELRTPVHSKILFPLIKLVFYRHLKLSSQHKRSHRKQGPNAFDVSQDLYKQCNHSVSQDQ